MPKAFKIAFTISVILVVISVAAISVYGLNLGVDFKGGSVLEVQMQGDVPSHQEVREALFGIEGLGNYSLSSTDKKGLIIKSETLTEDQHQKILNTLRAKFGVVIERKFDSIGPSIGRELRSSSIKAIVVLMVVIVIYLGLVFRAMRRVFSPFILGVAGIIALLHDILIPLGVFAVLGHVMEVQIDSLFVAAILTILGYSIADSVIVFDRLRENVQRDKTSKTFGEIAVKSVRQTASRSINTSITTLLALFAVFFFGGETLKFFSLALIIGIGLGTYSSLFVATPLLYWWHNRRHT